MAGAKGVSLHDRFKALAWLSTVPNGDDNAYDLSLEGTRASQALGVAKCLLDSAFMSDGGRMTGKQEGTRSLLVC
jgi:hypothetical protein